ncbi:MAG TPA: MOSC N-terminal beta barrel domain-containing protein [Terriglobia bacterium]|nr:MOSC N-terminal beta barrel domain-containing protein [Terriglobia bacterium]
MRKVDHFFEEHGRSRDSRTSARLAEIRLHPIKSLDPVSVQETRIGPGGGLEFDRVWALYSADGKWVNGKSTAAIHQIRATFAPALRSVSLSAPGPGYDLPTREIAFPSDTTAAAEWFSAFFKQEILVRHAAEGFPDDQIRNGPMVISTATLMTVCEWFPEIDLEESRRRFRTPLEIDGVPAFWEDRLFRESEEDAMPFRIAEVHFEGTNPCPRCIVPVRDLRNGSDIIGFEKRFSTLRRAQWPDWARTPERIKHFYHLGINTRVAPTEVGKILRVGDAVSI